MKRHLVFLEGNIAESEEIFNTSYSKLIEGNEATLLVRAIEKRLMIKTASLLSRWNEALNWAKDLAKQSSWNEASVELYLCTLVQSLEFDDVAKLLEVKTHSPSESLSQLKPAEEFAWIEKNLDKNAITERWLRRGKLAHCA